MNWLFDSLAALRPMAYLLLNQDFVILETWGNSQSFADSAHPLGLGEDCRLGLPELMGMEDSLIAVWQGLQPHLILPAITRSAADEMLRYFDLCVTKPKASELGDRLLVILEDVTERRSLEQRLVQASNEMSLVLDALETSKAYVDTLITSMADALLVTTAAGTIQTVNAATQTLLGYRPAELIQQPFARIVADENFLFPDICSPDVVAHSPQEIEIVCQTQSGEKRSIAFSYSTIATETAGQTLIWIGRDITDRQRAQQRLLAQYTTARMLSDAANLPQVIPQFLSALCQSLDWDLAELWLPTAPSEPAKLNEVSPRLRCAEVWSKPQVDARSFMLLTQQLTLSSGIGLPGQIWAHRTAQWIVDVTRDERFLRSPLAAQAGLQTSVGFPLQNGDEVLGVITCFSQTRQQPDPNMVQTLMMIGNQLGQFIKRKQAEATLLEAQPRPEPRLLTGLPDAIAARLQPDSGLGAAPMADTTVLVADLGPVTPLARSQSPIDLSAFRKQLFSAFDQLSEQHGLDPMKTARPAYMVVAGLLKHGTNHAQAIAEMALEMQAELARLNAIWQTNCDLRIGLHTGSGGASVSDIQKLSDNAWGDMLTFARQMQSQSLAGQIQVTASTYELLRDHYVFEQRELISSPGKGEMPPYLLSRRSSLSS